SPAASPLVGIMFAASPLAGIMFAASPLAGIRFATSSSAGIAVASSSRAGDGLVASSGARSPYQRGGSYPCPPQGWHRRMRRAARIDARTAPYFCKAATAYSEHVGVQRQLDGKWGAIAC